MSWLIIISSLFFSLNKWKGNLSEEEIKIFSDIIETIRINIQNGKNNIDVTRKLVKIKKSENKI